MRYDQPMDSSAHQILEKATQRQMRTRGKDRLNVTFVDLFSAFLTLVRIVFKSARAVVTAVAFTVLNQSS